MIPTTSPLRSHVLRPIGVIPAFSWLDEVTLMLREKHRKQDIEDEDYRITDVDSEELVFRCSGRTFSWRDKKGEPLTDAVFIYQRFYRQLGSVLYDARNQPILNISNKLLSLNHEYIVREGQSSNISNSRELARIVSRVAFGDGASKMDIRFANAVDGEDIELTLEGDWTNRQVVSFRCLKIAF